MFKESRKTKNNLEDKIISFVSEQQPVHIGEIFKNLKISQTRGLNYVTTMINQGKLIYASNNQVNVF